MKNNNNISPIGLKGQQINERMKELMGIQSINENKSKVVVELTKMGPDGNAYAIIRENHEWYIKKTNKTTNLVAEDFKYIGGLMNKKSEAYPSYAKAIKHLNLKFKSLAEAHNFKGEINVFENDNLISENMPSAGGFYEMTGNGFSGKGNNEGQESMWTEETDKNNPWAICTASVGREDSAKYEACVMGVKQKMGMDESMTEESFMDESLGMEEVELTEFEQAIENMRDIDNMYGDDMENQTSNDDAYSKAFSAMDDEQYNLDEEEMSDKDKKFAALAEPKDKITYADKIAGATMHENKLSIAKAIESMDSIIDGLKKKV
jgi:hypothetical protein